ncbi:hypothetical protein GLI01_03330 [Gluconacetobacter liquefaciens]|nr:hypothetical protein [Gluconacetobacter liquefaciens]RDI39659.1 hypothetical protein C7453_102453 [Gluconacetobacter liquefaciens]GBQ98864.1 hypothetical protein AA0522_1158 [Gluconacetobacter liquefaciens NRIC 0522]GEB36298.1 hypothetical protein GLI01_03330 [Gluconacetobacter liquefaciens]
MAAVSSPMLSLPVLMPLVLCWPFLSMGVLAACSPASARAAAIGLSAIGLVLAVLAVTARSVWPATPFAVPSGPLGLLLPLPLVALFVASLSAEAAPARRGTRVLIHGLAGGAVAATACADPLSGAVAIGGVAMLVALATAVTRGAARAGWDLFRLSLSGILLAVPGAALMAASDAAGRLEGLGGLLLTVGLGTVAGLGPAAPVVLAAGDAGGGMALAPVMTAVPVLRHLAEGPDRLGVMALGLVTVWLMALSIRVASAERRGRLSVGLMIGLGAMAAGAGGGAGQAGLVALLLSVALLARQDVAFVRGAPLVHAPFLPFGGVVLTLVALCDAAPLLVFPVAVGVAVGSPGPVGSAFRAGWLGRGVAGVLLAGLVVLVLWGWR